MLTDQAPGFLADMGPEGPQAAYGAPWSASRTVSNNR